MIAGAIRTLVRGADDGREFARVTVAIAQPPQLLRGGMVVRLRFRMPMAALEPFCAMPSNPPDRSSREPARIYLCHDHPDTIALEPGRCPIDARNRMSQQLGQLERIRWWCPMHPSVTAEKAGSTCAQCGGMALQPRVVFYAPAGQVLAMPQSAVVDTGARRIVFVESMPGMFDGVEVVLGQRCGDFYPVVSGIEPGQKVAIAGAFLLDA
jgi:membrane fusion protein, copper/silver efflux system